ncbi:hypothetical protein D3C85_1880820 [compost metagenome]
MHANDKQPTLQIRNAGRMWRVIQGERVLAFARTYAHAKARAADLERQPTHH